MLSKHDRHCVKKTPGADVSPNPAILWMRRLLKTLGGGIRHVALFHTLVYMFVCMFVLLPCFGYI